MKAMNDYEWLSKQMENVSKANADQAARIAALEAEKAKLIEALEASAQVMVTFGMTFPAAWSKGDQKILNQVQRVIAEVTGHAK